MTTTPKDGEFWIVEFRGEVTVGRLYSDNPRRFWEIPGYREEQPEDETFRTVRKLDLGALVDREDVQKDRLIWLLIEAAGGKIEISRDVAARMNPGRSEISWQQNPFDGSTTYTSKTRDAT